MLPGPANCYRGAMLKVGLTGNIGSGKSSVARLFSSLGAAVIDADHLAREATADADVLAQIRQQFGQEVVQDGELDRAALAARVFSDAEELAKLNAIVHPWVRSEAARLQEEFARAGASVVVQDIPLLFEGGLQAGFDRLVVVHAPLETRLGRVQRRSGLTREEFLRRDSSQWPLERKMELADHLIDNSGTEEELRQATAKVWRELTQELPPD